MSAVSDTYFSISAPSEGLYKDRGSRFIAFARPVEREEEVREFLESVRREYHDARHHCYAFKLGLDGGTWRASDDGEPSGSAGRQILGQIDSAGLSDVLVVVVRYFGGIKLGVPGLIKAYKESAADALSKAQKVEKAAGRTWSLSFPYGAMPQVMKALKELGLQYSGADFGESCSLRTRVRLSLEEAFLGRMESLGVEMEAGGL